MIAENHFFLKFNKKVLKLDTCMVKWNKIILEGT